MEKFCSQPWTGIDISTQSIMKPCCVYKSSIAQDLESYFASPELKKLQDQFSQGQQPEGCSGCWSKEDVGLPSKRTIDLQYSFGGQHPNTDSLKMLGMRFGNTCNLACVSCNSYWSSRWTADEKKIPIELMDRKIFSHNQYYKNKNFIEDLVARSDDVTHIDIAGGEPFYADKEVHKTFLRSLKHPENIKLHYITNGTIFPDDEFWTIWKNFRKIDIQLSIDGIGKTFEYLRYPAEWDTVYKNLQKYRVRNIQVSVGHTVSWLNVLYLDEFLEWCEKQKLDAPFIGPVSNPEWLSVQSLPSWAKEIVNQQLANSQRPGVREVIDYMYQADTSHCFEKGLTWLRTLDQIRSNSFLESLPGIKRFVQNL
jgi:sulfatase maturation enzyme AslB (radical SAM superfamily)